MSSRFVSLGIVLAWLGAMAWLALHDIVPMWTAQDAPRYTPGDWLTDELLETQARIENKYNHRVGTVWTIYTRRGDGLSRRDVAWINNFVGFDPFLIQAAADFTTEGRLDELLLEIFGASVPISLKGELYGDQLAFKLDVGPKQQYFKIDASMAGSVADAFRPFPALPDLTVGRSWRMQVVNPLTVMTGVGAKMIPMLVKVTGREAVDANGARVECFVVETDRARAWVDDRGIVLRQEMDLPYGGRIAVIDEPFDQELLNQAMLMAGERHESDGGY